MKYFDPRKISQLFRALCHCHGRGNLVLLQSKDHHLTLLTGLFGASFAFGGGGVCLRGGCWLGSGGLFGGCCLGGGDIDGGGCPGGGGFLKLGELAVWGALQLAHLGGSLLSFVHTFVSCASPHRCSAVQFLCAWKNRWHRWHCAALPDFFGFSTLTIRLQTVLICQTSLVWLSGASTSVHPVDADRIEALELQVLEHCLHGYLNWNPAQDDPGVLLLREGEGMVRDFLLVHEFRE
ncbi:hypothetical protein TcasGA2_TC033293 [Tribolium castaneum]|uniref:Uncharacterized protein n=1 Tax=Tribolium castaneum TaxID=7070 RepID=A0A139W9A0_TRICA|nr:hypothetical protein TcasGA2_TC033293 [Tribolium castaneum]